MTSEERASGRPARFGPFFRLESPTQTVEDAARQEVSGEVWGRVPRGGISPTVEAYRGKLPPDARGIEFFTDAAPDTAFGPRVRWRAGATGVREEGEFAKIEYVVTRNTQKANGHGTSRTA